MLRRRCGRSFPKRRCRRTRIFRERTGARIFLKREDLSPVRSYKIRGAFNFFRNALAGGTEAALFVCASAGNHAQGFAFVCRHFGKKGVVFMPVTTPQQKIDKTRIFGGEFVEIRLVGDFFDDCYRAAIDFCRGERRPHGAALRPQGHHRGAGDGRLRDRRTRCRAAARPTSWCCRSAAAGCRPASRAISWSRGASRASCSASRPGAPSLKQSLEAGRRVKLAKVDNFVDGAAVAEIGREPFRHLKDFPADTVRLIPENRVCATIIDMLNVEGVVLEPAGALAIDALKDFPKKEIRGKTIVLRRLGRQFRLRAAARREGEGAALRRAEEIFRLPLSAAARRAARFPAICSARTTTSPASST